MTAQTFNDDLRRRQAAAFGAVKIITRDQYVAQKAIRTSVEGRLLVWSCASGLWEYEPDGTGRPLNKDLTDPHAVVAGLEQLFKDTDDRNERYLTVALFDLDHWLESVAVLRRRVLEAARLARELGYLLLFVSRHDKFHPELSDEISVLRHPLPDREATAHELRLTMEKNPDTRIVDAEAALDAVQGLTSTRQMDAFGLGIADALLRGSGEVDLRVLRRFKETEIGKLDYLKVSEPTKTFDDLLGHEYLKAWMLRRRATFSPEARDKGISVPKGVLLVGPPGVGKTRLGEAVASEWGMPFITLNFANLFSSFIGESESNISNAIEIVERIAPCVLLIDEIEHAVGSGGGDRDGGTTERVIGQLLTWMSIKTAPVFVVFTSNFSDKLPPALIRKGRLNEVFCLDFPPPDERRAVFDYYLSKAPHAVKSADLARLVNNTEQWSPAEIEAAVDDARTTAFADGDRLMTVDDIHEEIEKTVPVSVSRKTDVEAMRAWAKEYARATHYVKQKAYSGSAGRAARKVQA